MAYRKPQYPTTCYYGGKPLGRCTTADGEAFSELMKACGGSAARVLREFSYFSPELKAILEKTAEIQAGQHREMPPPGLFVPPKDSPWGEVDYYDTLCPGVFLVSTSGHGGVMVAKDIEEILSPAARKCALRKNGFLCYEEDCDEAIIFRELLDKKLWSIPERINDKAAFEDRINESLQKHHPAYWQSRKNGRFHASPEKPAPAHNER